MSVHNFDVSGTTNNTKEARTEKKNYETMLNMDTPFKLSALLISWFCGKL